ncbi:hypothetical protein QE364_003904 [Nocardioides zeae]|uniref:Uncharacterized protein n=1 Tax=Nocardioides zeae TaxID=1457234 RepID=A0ACC6INI9_9ACTN|nr:hypothetical protein [Nocardioides zeae]MDR6212173.1 hypothetical protein [Nocardioides zeae]
MSGHRNAVALDTLVRGIKSTHPGTTIGTYRAGSGNDSDHKPWLKDSNGVGVVRAADVMGRSLDPLARNLASQLGRHPALGPGAYIIWRKRIISTDRLGEGWRTMGDRGGDTANHMDHVHVSLTKSQTGFDSRRAWGPLMTGSAPPPPGLADTSAGAALGYQPASVGVPDLESIKASITGLVVTGAVLFGGVALVGIGAARLTRPSKSRGAAA